MKINKWHMLNHNRELLWTLDTAKLDVTDNELCECISEQIYGDLK